MTLKSIIIGYKFSIHQVITEIYSIFKLFSRKNISDSSIFPLITSSIIYELCMFNKLELIR